jgi:outer membrane biosynthesis protein TonB
VLFYDGGDAVDRSSTPNLMKIMIKHFSILLLLIPFLSHHGLGQTAVQNSDAKPVNTPEFQLSPAAEAAGIDGKLSIGLTINADGRPSDLRIYGGPMWPCGASTPNSQIEEVRKEVRKHVLGMTFSPEIKDGKPKSVSGEITFMLSDRFRGASKAVGKVYQTNANDPGLIDIGLTISSRVESLPRPFLDGARGIVLLQILVDENGNVTSAGSFKGEPSLVPVTRDAACKAKFKPAIANGKPVRMTGTLSYILR